MRLSAIDCIGRGVSNLRANWELVLLQFLQGVVLTLLSVIALVGTVALLGATFLFEMSHFDDWTEVLERLEGLSFNWGLLAISLALLLILATVLSLVYSWFQAGIFATLERGERQAPPAAGVDSQLFRTFRGRDFMGWGSLWVWRYFWFFGGVGLVFTILLSVVIGIAALLAVALRDVGGFGAVMFGCAAAVPLVALMVAFNLWVVLGMALLPREEYGVWRASRRALTILRQRLGGVLLIGLIFIIASLGLALVFMLLTQGMATALQGRGVASFGVQALLALAQWLLSSMLAVSFYSSIVALARAQIDMPLRGSTTGV
ncbi:MAG: hypothetical protein O7A98_10215 [Acidobacteria bacterium]|nr:hypothetical protein [Acidobacteriota bacterium]